MAKKRKSASRIERTAYHEAGHAVAWYSFGKTFRHASIVAKDDLLGHVLGFKWRGETPEITMNDQMQMRCFQRIIIILAGTRAEAKFSGRKNHLGARKDYQDAFEMACYVGGSEEEIPALQKWLGIRAKAVIEYYWPGVKALAKALLKRKTISGAECRRIIDKGMGYKSIKLTKGR